MMKNKLIGTALKGMAMGMAEVVPGVSGGTIAFISGIYEQLINSIKSIDLKYVGLLLRGKWKLADEKVSWVFILPLLIGMAGGIVVGVFGIHYLLAHYPILIWSFFFGLIIASAVFIGSSIHQWGVQGVILFLAGAAIAYSITLITPVQGAEFSLVALFFSGILAISALLLPGISGSFILLLLGAYTTVLHLARNVMSQFNLQDAIALSVFALGCLVGVLSFSRLLSWMFKYYKKGTLLVLTGFIVGALNKIWPWRNPVSWIDDNGNVITGEAPRGIDIKILQERNVSPFEYNADPMIVLAILAFIAGIILIYFLFKQSRILQDN